MRRIALVSGLPVVLILTAVCLGRYPLTLSDVWELLRAWMGGRPVNEIHFALLFHVRLPRALLAAMVGGSLAVSGAAFQGLFRNPLVSSGMLGVSSGAGFGAALALILFKTYVWVYALSFGFGLAAVGLCVVIGRFCASRQAVTLVLGGVVVGAMFSALISFLKYAADPYDELPAIVFWLMGSFSRANYDMILAAGIPMLIGFAGLFVLRWRLNILSMGEKEARSLGLNVSANRAVVIACATLATAAGVCVSGVIGWVGLVVPHMGRMITGNDNRYLVPVSFAAGACFMILVDTASRIISSSELPLSILTALIGGPFFVWLLRQTRGRQW